MVSSSRGWRSTIAAASAPANPAAPSTATRSPDPPVAGAAGVGGCGLCTQSTAELGELGLDRDARGHHVLVGERALRRAELETHCQRLPALTDLLAAVHVEELHAVEQVATACAHRV